MNALFTVLAIFVIIAAVLLILVVLLQNGKGDGLASNFVAGNQTFGVRQTADILEKVTWGLVIFILVVSIASSFAIGGNGSDSGIDITNKLEQAAKEQEQPDFSATPLEQAAPSTETPAEEVPATGSEEK
ncbi:MAG: preprotein translocase subunit SecG [Bacteroidales bacterium]|nr:preprotein translocase subunit SecG [Bacteroidales bacterium]